MRIVGFNLKKILVERKKAFRGGVKINTLMNIIGIKKEDIKIVSGKDVLSFDFQFKINYQGNTDDLGDVAGISFEGNVLCLLDPKQTKKILNEWKNKKISEDVKVTVLNTILSKCNLKALFLEEEVGLPLHLPLPKLKPETKEEAKEEKTKKK